MFYRLVIAMVYYGLSLNAGSLAGDIFLNNALNGLVELIGYFFVQFTMDRLVVSKEWEICDRVVPHRSDAQSEFLIMMSIKRSLHGVLLKIRKVIHPPASTPGHFEEELKFYKSGTKNSVSIFKEV